MIKRQLDPTVSAKLQALEDRLDADYRRFSTSKSRRFNLVYAEGFEAMTCALAITAFADTQGARGPVRPGPWGELWAWHAAEEIEHRTVAFDVYEHFVGSYPYRVIGSLRAQWHFQRAVDRMQRVLLASQGAPARPQVPPWLRAGRTRYLRTFRPDYDPGRLDPGPIPALILAQYAT
jgi:predicted metal-dependent hydrolase